MNDAASVTRLWSRPDALGVEWADGESSEFASMWLRDNCREDRDPQSGQRLLDIVDLPSDPRIVYAAVEDRSINVRWEAEPQTSSFTVEWLRAHAANASQAGSHFAPRLWLEAGALDAERDYGWAAFAEARSDRLLRARWLGRLLRDGIAFLRDVPPTDSAIFDIANLAGRVLETNYGPAFDVRSVPQPENLAYSDLGLGLHTDNPYREPVPGFQVLHALVTSPHGGDSLFGDGFAIAEHLRAVDPAAFAVLTRTAVPFLYRSKDTELYAERPLIQLSCAGEVVAVHYNSRSIAPLRPASPAVARFYAAYRQLAALLRDPQFHLRYRLRDGDAVVFDNRRTLHGRSAFSSATHPRHLRGCYLSRDSVHSEAAVLRRATHAEADS